jgi:DNA modification methylase
MSPKSYSPKQDKIAQLTTTRVALADLKPHPKNPRIHPKPGTPEWNALLKSLQNDYFDPLVVNSGRKDKSLRNVLVSGHLRLKVLLSDGFTHADVVYRDYTADEHIARMLAANKQQGDNDDAVLAALLKDLESKNFDLDLTGFTESNLDELLASFPDETPLADAEPQLDRATELNKKWNVKPCDLFQIGDHRLLCGDATKQKDVERVMGVTRAEICITSPPYNVAAGSGLPNKDKYLAGNDRKPALEYLALLTESTSLALDVCEFVWVNVQSVAGNKVALIEFLHRFAPRYADTVIWDKLTAEPAMKPRVLNSRFEFVHCFSSKGNRAVGTKDFRGNIDNVLPLNSRQGKENSDVHRATFPLAFASWFISNFCNPGEAVFDPFLGTGTTMVACEQLKRKCRGIELHPPYVAVCLERMARAFPNLEIKRL